MLGILALPRLFKIKGVEYAAMASDVGKVSAYNAVRDPSASPGALEALPTPL